MKFTIAYLYFDLLNLYGESGNVKVLKQQLEHLNFDVTIKYLSVEDTLHFNQYDLVYMGSGTEHNQKIALKHLIKYQSEVKKTIVENKFFLITGNSIELFGKSILDLEKKKYKGLGIFSYTAREEKKRMIGESVVKFDELNEPIIGFQNQSGILSNHKYPLFQVLESPISCKEEGIHQNNFFGTYLLGPILVRNPHFLTCFLTKILKEKKIEVNDESFDLTIEYLAYQTFMEQYKKSFLEK